MHILSLVIPVYQGEKTLPGVLRELEPLTHPQTINDIHFRIGEVILVHDGARDDSARVMQELAAQYPFVRNLWLSRNFGQHPATLAGMASTTGQWVVTIDEDGQQNPADIGRMLEQTMRTDAQLVYAHPLNKPPHGFLRNAASGCAKWILIHILGNRVIGEFNSFRLIDGEIARSLAAYCGNSVFLDIALSWVTGRVERCGVTLRPEGDRPSGYSFRSLLHHFWRLMLTSGTKPLRFITLMGMLSLLTGIALTAYALWVKFAHQVPVQGWTSLVIVVSLFSGTILFSLGIIAEYLAVALGIVMGKPLYLVVSRAPNGKSEERALEMRNKNEY